LLIGWVVTIGGRLGPCGGDDVVAAVMAGENEIGFEIAGEQQFRIGNADLLGV
jgi:hypothetical protein